INPFNVLDFPEDVATERGDLYSAINRYAEEMMSKFILGQEPMENWDSFVETVKDMGVDRLLEIYTVRYDSLMKSDVIW
ncbi:MAG: hypothetical protein IJN71_07060, partial [Oscillospiraceae bacterium]|nr:hypothetical protein [Oscillospiraceae bacterium]